MLALKRTIPQVCTQSRLAWTQTRQLTQSPPAHDEQKPNTDQFMGILNVLNSGKDSTSDTLSDFANKNKKITATNVSIDFSGLHLSQPPHQLHINASPNNTIITLTRPNGAPLVTTSGGSAGFKKAARSGYEAAHQAAIQLLDKMNTKNLQIPNIHIVLKGFGPGRDAAFKALSTGAAWNVKRITDATPIPFGGCRPKKARRL